ncbi:class I SAM-dependent methyltransferase|uniref:class I SAM-dependent methyltransferase n=1 Tax=Stenotrophomonas sp. SbOxS2 TaxID=2723885 RepID=UPI0015D4231A|nr:class I SAM-dependent methyltransferase [Stenotrophomonas sp. SbOxS2]NYT99518.1 class I SAM-dependent methyltransferase [Stenotrophomonas sp. SbOxS2]
MVNGGDMSERNDWMVRGLDRNGLALEIAPLDKPVLRQQEWDVRYADHLPREGLLEKYAEHSTVDSANIQPVHFVVGRQGILDAVAGHRFHSVIASHVIEHVPDPVRWLQEIHALCVDGGMAVFAIPDRLQCFDRLRRPTEAIDWLGAWLEAPWRPAPRNVIDALINECSWKGTLTWAGPAMESELTHNRQPTLALQMALEAVRSADYYDVHCWAVRPPELFAIFYVLAVLDLFPFEVDSYRDTEGNEFLLRLRRNDASTWVSRLSSIPLDGTAVTNAIPEDFSVRAYLDQNADLVAARVDPIKHWLEYGRNENRRYT